jgi:hypothetical protein
VLPGGVNGEQLAERARSVRPGLKVLFTTGYARNAIMRGGRLEAGVELITKPSPMRRLRRASARFWIYRPRALDRPDFGRAPRVVERLQIMMPFASEHRASASRPPKEPGRSAKVNEGR